MALEHVPGRNAGKIIVYALSTCPWCQRAKQLLNELGVEYYFTDVDLEPPAEKEASIDAVRKWNPACSFPTIVVDDRMCIIGFKENEIREVAKA